MYKPHIDVQKKNRYTILETELPNIQTLFFMDYQTGHCYIDYSTDQII